MTKVIDLSVSDIMRTHPAGGVDNAISSAIRGINHRKNPSAVPINKDDYGMVFFTRPQLNLTLENIRHDRYFNQLATFEPDSIQRIISCTLDPRLHYGGVTTTLVDHENAFIPILSNHVVAMSGWPDSVVETFTSKPGMANEVFSMVDSQPENYGAWSANVTFRNMTGDLITILIDFWRKYAANVYMGKMVPYFDLLVENEIDYMTRIWRLVLDSKKMYVQKIGCTGASFPTSVPFGKSFDYQVEKPLNSSNDQIDVQFQCMGAMYNDPILVSEFNKTVEIFNANMRKDMRPTAMEKVPYYSLDKFNFRGYPRINPGSYELEWYVPAGEYAKILALHSNTFNSLSANTPDEF
jgi:hypothetical protein